MAINFNKLIETSVALKANQTGRCFHTSFILSKGKVLAIGMNDYNKLHLNHRFGQYHPRKINSDKHYVAGIHSEIDSILKLGRVDFSRYELVNIRIDNNGKLACAYPCPNCLRVITDQLQFKRIYYSISENKDFGII